MKKKVWSLLLVLTMATGLLAGCGSKEAESDGAAEKSGNYHPPCPEGDPLRRRTGQLLSGEPSAEGRCFCAADRE